MITKFSNLYCKRECIWALADCASYRFSIMQNKLGVVWTSQQIDQFRKLHRRGIQTVRYWRSEMTTNGNY